MKRTTIGVRLVTAVDVRQGSRHATPAHQPGVPHERSVECEAVQVPELDRLVAGGGGKLLAVGADEALEDVPLMSPQLVQRLKVGGQGGTCKNNDRQGPVE